MDRCTDGDILNRSDPRSKGNVPAKVAGLEQTSPSPGCTSPKFRQRRISPTFPRTSKHAFAVWLWYERSCGVTETCAGMLSGTGVQFALTDVARVRCKRGEQDGW